MSARARDGRTDEPVLDVDESDVKHTCHLTQIVDLSANISTGSAWEVFRSILRRTRMFTHA